MNSIASLTAATAKPEARDIVIEIGGLAVRLRSGDAGFLEMLGKRYAGFLSARADAEFEFDVLLEPPGTRSADEDVRVTQECGRWSAERGDFRAEWNATSCRGSIRQLANPYSADALLRIVHSIVLARRGGFLVHSASAVRNGRAFLFSGVSGAGKTTMARLAPEDATLLTDEISYLRRDGQEYSAFGTPFTGELNKAGEHISAPLAAIYLLAKGPQNRVDPIPPAEAVRAFLGNVLFFAEDARLVRCVFESACELVARVPVYRLTSVPDQRVWEMIR